MIFRISPDNAVNRWQTIKHGTVAKVHFDALSEVFDRLFKFGSRGPFDITNLEMRQGPMDWLVDRGVDFLYGANDPPNANSQTLAHAWINIPNDHDALAFKLAWLCN